MVFSRHLLDVEARIGELSLAEPQVQAPKAKGAGPGRATALSSGQPAKHERLGLREKQMHVAEEIARHPEAVEAWERGSAPR